MLKRMGLIPDIDRDFIEEITFKMGPSVAEFEWGGSREIIHVKELQRARGRKRG